MKTKIGTLMFLLATNALGGTGSSSGGGTMKPVETIGEAIETIKSDELLGGNGELEISTPVELGGILEYLGESASNHVTLMKTGDKKSVEVSPSYYDATSNSLFLKAGDRDVIINAATETASSESIKKKPKIVIPD